MKRKDFLRSIAFSAVGMPLLIQDLEARRPRVQSGQSTWPPVDGSDEQFWKFVRDEFPLTHDRIYLNTGGLGASPYAVIDAVKEKMDELEKISEPGHNETLWKEIKTAEGQLLGCDADELAFTRNTTEGINIVANGLPLRKGDEIITTTQEHVGNALTWMGVERRTGAVIKFFEPSTVSAQDNIDRIQKLMTRRTRVISIPHIVTTTGLILPVKDIADLARTRNVWLFIDGAQSAGMITFNLHDIGCDAYATSGHKWLLGPKETGLLYVRKDMMDTIEAQWIGAYSDSGKPYDFQKGTFEFNPTAQRYEYGTVSVPLRVGLGTAVKFLQRIGTDVVWKRDQALSTRLFRGLKEIPSIKVLSPENDTLRSAMITFMHERLPYLEMQKQLDTWKLRTRGVSEGGLAALRISTHIYTLMEDVERVLEAVRSLKV